MSTIKQEVFCTDGCGKSVPTPEAAMQVGWTVLQITGRLRCPQCARALAKVNNVSVKDVPNEV